MRRFVVTRPGMPWRPTKTVEAEYMVTAEGRLEFYDAKDVCIEMFAVGAWTEVKEEYESGL